MVSSPIQKRFEWFFVISHGLLRRHTLKNFRMNMSHKAWIFKIGMKKVHFHVFIENRYWQCQKFNTLFVVFESQGQKVKNKHFKTSSNVYSFLFSVFLTLQWSSEYEAYCFAWASFLNNIFIELQGCQVQKFFLISYPNLQKNQKIIISIFRAQFNEGLTDK